MSKGPDERCYIWDSTFFKEHKVLDDEERFKPGLIAVRTSSYPGKLACTLKFINPITGKEEVRNYIFGMRCFPEDASKGEWFHPGSNWQDKSIASDPEFALASEKAETLPLAICGLLEYNGVSKGEGVSASNPSLASAAGINIDNFYDHLVMPEVGEAITTATLERSYRIKQPKSKIKESPVLVGQKRDEQKEAAVQTEAESDGQCYIWSGESKAHYEKILNPGRFLVRTSSSPGHFALSFCFKHPITGEKSVRHWLLGISIREDEYKGKWDSGGTKGEGLAPDPKFALASGKAKALPLAICKLLECNGVKKAVEGEKVEGVSASNPSVASVTGINIDNFDKRIVLPPQQKEEVVTAAGKEIWRSKFKIKVRPVPRDLARDEQKNIPVPSVAAQAEEKVSMEAVATGKEERAKVETPKEAAVQAEAQTPENSPALSTVAVQEREAPPEEGKAVPPVKAQRMRLEDVDIPVDPLRNLRIDPLVPAAAPSFSPMPAAAIPVAAPSSSSSQGSDFRERLDKEKGKEDKWNAVPINPPVPAAIPSSASSSSSRERVLTLGQRGRERGMHGEGRT